MRGFIEEMQIYKYERGRFDETLRKQLFAGARARRVIRKALFPVLFYWSAKLWIVI